MDHSIIVYRNPMEKAFWESGWMPSMVVFFIAMLVLFIATYKLLEKVTGKTWNQPNWFMYVSSLVSFIGACLVVMLIRY